MQLNFSFRFVVPGLDQRILDRIRPFGELSKAARALGITRSRLSNVLQGQSRGFPLWHILTLEKHLGVDLLGDDRQRIAGELRASADRLDPPGNPWVILGTEIDRIDSNWMSEDNVAIECSRTKLLAICKSEAIAKEWIAQNNTSDYDSVTIKQWPILSN